MLTFALKISAERENPLELMEKVFYWFRHSLKLL
jgi:hypothetical protein